MVEKEDLEAVTDAPISVSGGAPTADASDSHLWVSLFIVAEGVRARPPCVYKHSSARRRREARLPYRVADGGGHRVVRRVHTDRRTPNRDVCVNYASQRPGQRGSPRPRRRRSPCSAGRA